MPRTVVVIARPAAQYFLECLPELWAEDSVDDGVQSRVEISQPEEKTRQGEIENFFKRKS